MTAVKEEYKVNSRQCCGSMTFWGGSGSMPWIRIRFLDPDPAIFIIDLQDANKKLI